MLPTDAIFELKYTKMRMRPGPGASPRIPIGELTELPDPLAGFEGAASRQGTGERGGNEEKGRGSVPHFFFSQFNDCSAVIVAPTYTRSL